jgi:hypothetical protein
MKYFKKIYKPYILSDIDISYEINESLENYPNFIYQDSCFTLLDSEHIEEIFLYIGDNIDFYSSNENIYDLTDEKDIINFCASKGYVFLLKKYLYYLMTKNPSTYIKLNDAFFIAIKNKNVEVVKLLHNISPDLLNNIDDKIFNYIIDLNGYTITRNIDLYLYLAHYSSEIEEIIKIHIRRYHVLNYEEIINNLETVSFDNNDIKECPICYDKKSELMTQCNHQFCIDCIKTWWNTKRDFIHKCPYCKIVIIPNNCKKIVSQT